MTGENGRFPIQLHGTYMYHRQNIDISLFISEEGEEDADMGESILEQRTPAGVQVFEHRRGRHPVTWLCPNCQTVHPIHRWHHGTVDGREYCNYCNAKRVILNHMKPTSWRTRSRYCNYCGWRGQVIHNIASIDPRKQYRVM